MSHIGKKRKIRPKNAEMAIMDGQKKPSVPTYRSFQVYCIKKRDKLQYFFQISFKKASNFIILCQMSRIFNSQGAKLD